MRETSFSDPAFLAGLKNRDRTAWEQIVDTYLPQLLRAGRGMGFTPEENEDLAQSAFTALMEGIDRFERRSHIRTYLFGIFYNKISECTREKGRTQDYDPIDQVVEFRFDARGRWQQPPVDIERKIFRRELAEIVQQCVEALPRAQGMAFYLREVEEMTSSEICEKIGITATNLSMLLFRARKRLRECVEKKGVRKGTRV
jgi:RNA polymerase sigma-70 factor, ECF subfamily